MAGAKKSLAAAVGLDIGSDMIKVVEAKAGKRGINITGVGVAPTPQGAIENSVIMDPAAVGKAVKKLLSDSGIKTKPVVSAVAGQSSVMVRVIEVPRMSTGELAETMKFEVERQLPLSINEVVMDFAPIDKPNQPPDAQNMEVLLAVAQQDQVNNHVEALFAAGLSPKAIDIEPLAASRSLIEIDDSEGKPNTVAIVNIGANNTDVGIFEGGLLTFACPPLQIAGSTFTHAVSEYMQIPMEDAERLKKQFAAVAGSALPEEPEQDAGPNETHYDGYAVDVATGVEPTISGTAMPSFDLEPEPQRPRPLTDLSSEFDLGGGTGEPVPSGPAQPQDDVFDLGGDDAPAVKPVFDLEDVSSVEIAAPESPTETETVAQPVASYDLDSEPEADLPADVAVPVESFEDDIAQPVPIQPLAPTGDAETKRRVGEAIAPILADLAAELRRSLEYYQSTHGSLPEKVFISGGTAKLRGLDKFLEDELNIPVRVADPFANVPVSSARYSEQYLKEIAPLFSVSVGLAVREMLPG